MVNILIYVLFICYWYDTGQPDLNCYNPVAYPVYYIPDDQPGKITGVMGFAVYNLWKKSKKCGDHSCCGKAVERAADIKNPGHP